MAEETKGAADLSDLDLDPTLCAVQLSDVQGSREVGFAFLAPRPRSGEADKVAWRLGFYQFLDNEQFSLLESLLVQLQCQTCFLSIGKSPSGDVSKILTLLESAGVGSEDAAKTVFKPKDVEHDLRRLLHDVGQLDLLSEHLTKPLPMGCVAALIAVRKCMSDPDLLGTFTIEACTLDAFVRLDSAAVSALNLLPDPRDPVKLGSLHSVLSRGCWSKLGERLLRRWLLQPLRDMDAITERQQCVELFKDEVLLRDELKEVVRLPDMQRIAARLQRKTAGLVDIVQVVDFANLLPHIAEKLREYQGVHKDLVHIKFIAELDRLAAEFQTLVKMADEVIDMPRARTHGEYVINANWSEELQELASTIEATEAKIMDEYERIKRTWGSDLDVKCERDPRRGIVLRTKRANDKKLRAHLQVRVCTVLKDGVHFSTTTMEPLGKQLKDLKDQYEEQQKDLVTKAVDVARTYLPVIEGCTALVAELDAFNALGAAAATAPIPYVRPTLTPPGTGNTQIVGSRHPVLEMQDDVSFIPNNYNLDRAKSRFHIITGPNMGGKSTYIRQLGTLAIMAQIGSFVPAISAQVSLIDCVLARVGAGDMQLRGVSTFMAEMLEASNILKTATDASLVIIDELGRGTSTYDGFGLAWAISEHLAKRTQCFCMFATHFHELTALDRTVSGVCNEHVTAHTTADTITMLYEVKPGPCPSSFGIHVAELAAFPPSVIEQARHKAAQLEKFSSRGRELMLRSTSSTSTDDDTPTAQGAAKKLRGAGFVSPDHGVAVSLLKAFVGLPINSMSDTAARDATRDLVAQFLARPADAAALRSVCAGGE